MKRLILLAFIILMSNISFSQTNVGGHMIGKVYDNHKEGCKVDGKLIIPCKYESVNVYDFGEHGGIVLEAVKYRQDDSRKTFDYNRIELFDINGNRIYGLIEERYVPLEASFFSTKTALLMKYREDGGWESTVIRGKGDSFRGVVYLYDIEKKFVMAADAMWYKHKFSRPYSVHYFTKECDQPCEVIANKDGKVIFPTTKGLRIMDLDYRVDFGGDIFRDFDAKWYNEKGEYLFTCETDLPDQEDIMGIINHVIYYKTKGNGLWGVKASNGKELLAPEFTKVELIAGKNILYEMNGMQGVMTLQGKHIIPLSRGYTSITWSQTFKCYNFEKYGYKGTCNANGVQTSITKVAVPVQQQPAQPASNNQPRQQQQPSQGSQPDVKVPAYIPCPTCGGTLHCPTCAGTGSYWSGSDKRRCGVCNGTGVCQSCHGTGTNAVIYY
ncbi:MAG: hypothetical protein II849_00380 [Bacteroidales bacterium]|nr:hypothetical protein [Bacteroidales bacterium]